MLTALTRKFRKSSDVQLLPVAAACPSTASGADMYGLAADAWTIALWRTLSAYADEIIPVGFPAATASRLLMPQAPLKLNTLQHPAGPFDDQQSNVKPLPNSCALMCRR